jgi:WhiB family redox-sensing transcriptional regulator
MTLRGGDWGIFYTRRSPHNLPRPLLEGWSWQFRGKCRDYPLEVFFPEARGGNLTRREERAKRICVNCPVIQRCREYALSAPEAYGIWGAMTPRERAHHLTSRQPSNGDNGAAVSRRTPSWLKSRSNDLT